MAKASNDSPAYESAAYRAMASDLAVVRDVAQGTPLVLRAVARLNKVLTWFAQHWDAFDRLLALKGPAWVGERGEARHYGLLKNMAQRRKVATSSP